jgi:hypothetical protein
MYRAEEEVEVTTCSIVMSGYVHISAYTLYLEREEEEDEVTTCSIKMSSYIHIPGYTLYIYRERRRRMRLPHAL